MTLEHPNFLRNNPYYDDFSEEKDFLRILFKPGYGIQARELTQLQTLLQSQTSSFANYFFKDGSRVFGGNVNTAKVTFARVENVLVEPTDNFFSYTENSTDDYLDTLKTDKEEIVSNDNTNYVGTIDSVELEVYSRDETGLYDFSSPSSEVKLLHFLKAGHSFNDNYSILLLDKISGNNLDFNSILKVKDQNIYFKIITKQVYPNTDINKLEAYGPANLITVDSGIYYTNGFFVKNKRQHICPFYNSREGQTEESLLTNSIYVNALPDIRLFSFVSSRIGFSVVKNIVTNQEDNTLLDPSNGFYNKNAPGADRYKINLNLDYKTFDNTSIEIENYANKDFIQLVRIVKGNIDWVSKNNTSTEFIDLLARRTEDESGSYTVRPFNIFIKNHLRKDSFSVFVENTSDNPNGINYMQVNGIVWSTLDENGNTISAPQTFPCDVEDFENFNFSVLRVIEVESAKEEDINNPEFPTKKVKLQPLNSIKFNCNRISFNNFNYVKSPCSVSTTISLKCIEYNIDGDGTYSLYDRIKGDENKAIISYTPGKAYVCGYEQDFISNINLEYDRGRNINLDIITENKTLSSNSFLGNYIIADFDFQGFDSVSGIDWEKLPKFQLQSDEIATIVLETGEGDTAENGILSWSPFNITLHPEQENRIMFSALDSEQEYESVILINNNT